MSDILLKDKDGVEQTYTGIETVEFKTADGTAEFSEGGGEALSVNWRYCITKAINSTATTDTDIPIIVNLPSGAIIKEVWLTAARYVPKFGNPDVYPIAGYGFNLVNDYTVENDVLTAIEKTIISQSYPSKAYVGLFVVYELESGKVILNNDGTYNLNFNYNGNKFEWATPKHKVSNISFPFFRPPQNVSTCELGENCSNLPNNFMNQMLTIKEVKFSSSLTKIAGNICHDCPALTTLDFSKSLSVVTLNETYYIPDNENLIIKVPSSLESEWKAADKWSTFADKIVGV